MTSTSVLSRKYHTARSSSLKNAALSMGTFVNIRTIKYLSSSQFKKQHQQRLGFGPSLGS